MPDLLNNDTTASQIVSLIIAALLGGLIGLEREAEQRPAGLRTYMLVCVGSALFTILSIHAFPSELPHDTARVAAQIVTGIGFLGAGTVWRSRDHASGLTTAAGLWVAAAIGMAAGAGLGMLALAATVLVLIVLAVFLRFERRFLRRQHLRDEQSSALDGDSPAA
jgi:putative Mg2+ transporter-C (MgtC) family protein